MGNVYSAHNVAAYLIEELNRMQKCMNATTLQHLLANIDAAWVQTFGHRAFSEPATPTKTTYIQSVHMEYKQYGQQPITTPELEWHLPYGAFQFILRPYNDLNLTTKEQIIMHKVIANTYRPTKKALAV